MNKYISGATSIEIKLSAGKTKFFFPDLEILRNKRVKHMEIIPGFVGGYTHTPSGASISTVLTNKTFVTLVEKNTQMELIQNLHVRALNYENNRLFIDKIVDFSKSYISIPSATNDQLTDKSLLFVVWFDEPDVWGTVPQNNNSTAISSFEVKLNGLRTYFSENRDLRDKKFQNIILEFPELTPSGNASIVDGQPNKYTKFLTLRRKNKEFFVQIPIMLFYQRNTEFKLRLQNIQFDFESSYIDTLTTDPDDLKTVFFNAIIDDNK